MKFEQIDQEDFRKFAEKSPYASFMQTPEIAKYREQNGWTAYYLAARDEDNRILAATMLVAKPTFLGKSTFIAPGGPLLDLTDTRLTNFFIKHLAKFAKSHNGYVLHISPYYELIQRDRDGVPVPNGFNHERAKQNLIKLGFTALKSPDQPQYMFATDINDRDAATLLADFKRNTRNHIKKAEKKGVKVRELKRNELHLLKDITSSTANRRHFTDKPLKYYEQMYDLFAPRGEVKFLLAESDTSEHKTPLSAAMFMLTGSEVVYLFSGSDERYMREYNAQYAIQWYMMQYAAKYGYKRYNFYGIGGLPDPASKDYGIYDFKKGFGGQVIELIGSFELPLDKPLYYTHRTLSRLKSVFRK